MLLEGEELIGGWAKVYLDGYACPIFEEVALSEYAAPDRYGKNGWSKMPATMIRKVALCHALREAFPEDLGGLYGAEEMNQARQQEQAAPQPQEDPRKALWQQVADQKRQAIELGTKEEGITSWMAASILNPDGSPKAINMYTAEDIVKLSDFLAVNIRNHQELAAQQAEQDGYAADAEYEECAEPDYAHEDIPF